MLFGPLQQCKECRIRISMATLQEDVHLEPNLGPTAVLDAKLNPNPNPGP